MVVISCGCLNGLTLAHASPGELDPGFSRKGLLSFSIGTFGSSALGVVQQEDRKLVLAGSGTLDSAHADDFVALRLTPSGAADTTFGEDGVATADFGGRVDSASAIVAQADGKLLLVGSSYSTTGRSIGWRQSCFGSFPCPGIAAECSSL
jgi:uncharacterized delta-60 repeat protein